MKAHVYVPSTVLREIETSGRSNPVPELVQCIIRELGVPTVQRFDRARRTAWPNGKQKSLQIPRPLPENLGMPPSIPDRSCRYHFYGHKVKPTPDPEAYFALPDFTKREDLDGNWEADDLFGEVRDLDASEMEGIP
jgi:hypothetical protein